MDNNILTFCSIIHTCILLVGCGSDSEPSIQVMDYTFKIHHQGLPIGDAEVLLYNGSTCKAISSAISTTEGDLTFRDIVPHEFLFLVFKGDQIYYNRILQNIVEGAVEKTASIELDQFSQSNLLFLGPENSRRFSPGSIIELVVSFQQNIIKNELFEYDLASDNMEVSLSDNLENNGVIRKTVVLQEQRIYNFMVTVKLRDRVIKQIPFSIDNTLIPVSDFDYVTIPEVGVRLDWNQHEGPDFSFYEILANSGDVSCPDVIHHSTLTDRAITSYIDVNFPFKPNLCYAIAIYGSDTYSLPTTVSKTVKNPLSYVVAMDGTQTFIRNDILYQVGTQSLRDKELLWNVQGYDYAAKKRISSNLPLEFGSIIKSATITDSGALILIFRNNQWHILDESLSSLYSISATDDFIPITITDKGLLVVQPHESNVFQTIDKLGNVTHTSPSIDKVGSVLHPLPGNKFLAFVDPINPDLNSYVNIISLNDSGEFVDYKKYDLDRNYRFGFSVDLIVNIDLMLLLGSNGAIYDMNNNFKNVKELFGENISYNSISTSGKYASFYSNFEPSISLYDLSIFSKVQDISTSLNTVQVLLDGPNVFSVISKDGNTGVSRRSFIDE